MEGDEGKNGVTVKPLLPCACLLSKTFSSILRKDGGELGVSSTARAGGE